MWLVVNPTIGLPVFLGAVALGSFAVHVAVTLNTTWVKDFLSGRAIGSTDAALSAQTTSVDGASIAFEKDASGAVQSAVIVLDDGRLAKIDFEEAETVEVASVSEDLSRVDDRLPE
jgi:light-harvesting protein B-800-850 alpha chain